MGSRGGTAAQRGSEEAAPEELTRDVGLLVDWENLKISLERLKITPNVTALYEASREYGRVVVARAYADWLESPLRNDPPALYRAGIEPVYVPKRKYAGMGASATDRIVKNSVDVRMAVDAATLCHTNPNIATYILVSGDQDFLHVVNALRPYGRKLILIGVTGSLSQQLADFVDEVLYYERDIEEIRPPREKPRRESAEGPSVEEIFSAVRDILKTSATPGVASFSYVGLELKKRFPRYRPKIHGFKTLRSLIQAARDAGAIAGIETIGVQDWAFLRGAEKALKDILSRQGEAE